MRSSSPKAVAIIAGIIAASLTAIILLVLLRSEEEWVYFVVFSACVLIFFSIYFFVKGSLQSFILDKITPIYKTIYNLNFTKEEIKQRIKHEDAIIHVSDEVVSWASVKRQEIKTLSEVEHYRREVLGNITHELKTPIFSLQGYISTLLDGAIDDHEVNRQYLARSEKNIDRLIAIVNDLETISQLEGEISKLQIETFDLVKLIKETWEAIEMKAQAQRISFSFKASESSPCKVKADRSRIGQVLTNLFVNAINYGKEGGHIKVSISQIPGRVLIEVTDNGIGIDEKDLPRIFERFYRADIHRSRKTGGSGLGLAIVKHIIEAHYQTINVRSKKDEGSTFAFTLRKGD